MVKPFVTGLIRLAETLREQYRQKQRKECEDFHDRHVQVGTPLYYHLHFLIIPPYSSLNPNFLPVSTFPFFPSSHIPTLSLTGVEGHWWLLHHRSSFHTHSPHPVPQVRTLFPHILSLNVTLSLSVNAILYSCIPSFQLTLNLHLQLTLSPYPHPLCFDPLPQSHSSHRQSRYHSTHRYRCPLFLFLLPCLFQRRG